MLWQDLDCCSKCSITTWTSSNQLWIYPTISLPHHKYILCCNDNIGPMEWLSSQNFYLFGRDTGRRAETATEVHTTVCKPHRCAMISTPCPLLKVSRRAVASVACTKSENCLLCFSTKEPRDTYSFYFSEQEWRMVVKSK